METATQYLRDFYETRKQRNGSYSLSAFARDLGLSVSILSRTLNGRRPVSLKLGLQVSQALGLDEVAHKKLLSAILASSSKTAKISNKLRGELEHTLKNEKASKVDLLQVDRFQSMSQWYHLAILNLVKLPDFVADPVVIGRRLGITSSEAQGALERLQKLNLLATEGEKLKRTTSSLFVKVDRSHLAVRSFHTQMIKKAIENLESSSADAFKERHITAVTLTCSQTQLEAIKDKVDRFHSEIIAYLEQTSTPSDSVYQLNTQFFPLTRKTPTKDLV